MLFHRPAKLRAISSGQLSIEHLDTGKRELLKPQMLIGADGALSPVGRLTGLLTKRQQFIAVKTVVKKKHDNHISFYPYIKDFAWTIPIDEEHIEVGIATRANVHETFTQFCRKLAVTPTHIESAVIPLYDKKQRIYAAKPFPTALIGDAAGQVKATTGGGIVFGFRAARILADCLPNISSYPRDVNRHIGSELSLHLLLHKQLRKMHDSDWNELIRLCNDPHIKNQLGNISRDALKHLLINSIVRQPKLLTFAKLLARNQP